MTRSRPVPLLRRAVAAVAGALLGLAGAVAMAGAAGAVDAQLSGACGWDPDANEWVVTWTVTGDDPDRHPASIQVEAASDDSTVTGFPHEVDGPLVGVQRLPDTAASAALSLRVEWDDEHVDEVSGELDIADECDAPLPAIELVQWGFDCRALTITVVSGTDESVKITFAPSIGDPVDVEVGGGDPATVQFPAAEGLSVDMLSAGRSIVDPAQPIEITPAQWAELGCEDGDGDGEGGSLAATGTPVGLVIAGAVALLALGGGLFLIARRRRIIFTA